LARYLLRAGRLTRLKIFPLLEFLALAIVAMSTCWHSWSTKQLQEFDWHRDDMPPPVADRPAAIEDIAAFEIALNLPLQRLSAVWRSADA